MATSKHKKREGSKVWKAVKTAAMEELKKLNNTIHKKEAEYEIRQLERRN